MASTSSRLARSASSSSALDSTRSALMILPRAPGAYPVDEERPGFAGERREFREYGGPCRGPQVVANERGIAGGQRHARAVSLGEQERMGGGQSPARDEDEQVVLEMMVHPVRRQEGPGD